MAHYRHLDFPKHPCMFIRIVTRPAGEAPEWVRDAWIGLRLKTHQNRPSDHNAFGVLSGPQVFWRQLWSWIGGRALRVNGYAVDATEAVEVLSAENAEAAEWWRLNCPRMMDGRSAFIFRAEECEADEG